MILDLPSDIKERSQAVRLISDQLLLKQIYSIETHWRVKLEALINITDEDILIEIASGKDAFTFRKEAIDRINDQKILFSLAMKEKEEDLQKTIVLKMKIRPYLKQLRQHYIKSKVDPEIIAIVNSQLLTAENVVSFIFED